MSTNLDTLVVAGMGNTIPRTIVIDGKEVDVSAWSSGSALAERERMEDLIRQIAYGNVDDPQAAAADLMDEMEWE